jgi:hypothetical protein
MKWTIAFWRAMRALPSSAVAGLVFGLAACLLVADAMEDLHLLQRLAVRGVPVEARYVAVSAPYERLIGGARVVALYEYNADGFVRQGSAALRAQDRVAVGDKLTLVFDRVSPAVHLRSLETAQRLVAIRLRIAAGLLVVTALFGGLTFFGPGRYRWPRQGRG